MGLGSTRPERRRLTRQCVGRDGQGLCVDACERRHDDERGCHEQWDDGDENIYDMSCALNEHREGFRNN
eukprot:7928500-Heterocapsa_arctica.AAC.1